MHCGKANNQIFQNTGFDLKLIPRDPKQYCSPSITVRIYGGLAINGILAQVCLQWASDHGTHAMIISSTPECIIGIDILSNCKKGLADL